ncbi:CAMK family protein kinase [Tritrichomonas foetus]|uniref:CAMK family protein kinase n=1 Tax=Tritrichomonas foetus TaxID=1144522 RepID=A0A1J4KJP9_9EUKA|nr:CAMK family protein kinase [Tritrichomonas foetus]|eukprot:OHT11459.1 CAMK family protein kinase [Tritrichomonas foetus]
MALIGDYLLKEPIGNGSFSNVRLGEHRVCHTKVAIKIIPRNNFSDPEHLNRFHREVDLIKDLDHPLITEFFEVLEDDDNFYIIMEYVENGNMLDFVNNGGALTEERARHFFCQIISVLDYLHTEKNIMHRDLKAENVLIDRHDNIRLIDFGLSNMFSKENPYLKTACGSPGMYFF